MFEICEKPEINDNFKKKVSENGLFLRAFSLEPSMSADFEARIISLLWFQISPLRTESSDDPTDDQQAIPQPLAALSWLNDESA